MDPRLSKLINPSAPDAAGIEALRALAERVGVELPAEYLEFMARSDGGAGEVGSAWIELWPVGEILEAASGEPRYAGVLLFAGDGANTIYGFDALAGGEIVEGDWVGLNRDELIRRGRSFAGFLETLAAA
jgi:hypothetical protein